MLKAMLASGVLALSAATLHAAAPVIHAFEPDSAAHIIESHRGQAFVVMAWSLDCEYCQASMKTLAVEQGKYRNMAIVTIATDPLDDSRAAAMIRKKLSAVGIHADAWAFGAAPPEQLRYAIDPKWRGEIPRSWWFDAKGERAAYSGVITPAVIEKMMAR